MSATDYLPTGLNPGETFQLAFVTDATWDAVYPGISTYNTFVQDQWNGSSLKSLIETYLHHPNITFNCIGSTVAIDAIDNAVVGSGGNFKGVYKLNQEKIADDYADMWDGSIDSSLNITENGGAVGVEVWTGTDDDGGGYTGKELGSFFSSQFGSSGFVNTRWVSSAEVDPIEFKPFYALSEILTWPGCHFQGNVLVDPNYKKRFPDGRWNNTSSNQKLFKMTFCTGPSGKVITNRTRNLFKNTAYRRSSKQVYSYLIKNGIGPNTR